MNHDEVRRLTGDEMNKLWKELIEFVDDSVKRFNADKGHDPELPEAKFFKLYDGYQVSRKRHEVEALQRERGGKKSQPSKQSLALRLGDDGPRIEIRVDRLPAAHYQMIRGADGAAALRVENSETMTPQEAAEAILKPFLFDPT